MFHFEKINDKKILKSDLVKNAQAFFTTKDICICDKSDNAENDFIDENKNIISDYLKIERKYLISPVQTHGDHIEVAVKNRFEYNDTDGMIVTDKDIAIFLNFADCTPLIFYDEKQNIGAISHAGWKGTVQKIGVLTAQKLINEYNSNPRDICVLIGPSICNKCYEVGEDVYEKLQNSINMTTIFDEPEKKYKVDLKEINRKQLADVGITKIDICPYCTCCNNEFFYSYRKEDKTNLRHSAVLKLS